MNIRFYNAKILTMEEPVQVTEGQLWVSGQKIVYVGPDEEIETVYERAGCRQSCGIGRSTVRVIC